MVLRLLHASILVMLLGISLAGKGQAPSWQSAIDLGNNVYSTFTQADATGNVYLAGAFKGTLQLGGTTLTSVANSYDVFVAKCDANTNSFAWVQQAGGAGDDYPTAMAVNGAGIYLTGTFTGASASFGSMVLANGGNADVFIAKLTDNGSSAQFTWAKPGGSTASVSTSTLTVSAGAVYVGGTFRGATSQFGGMTLAGTNGQYGTDAFLCRLTEANNDASFSWASPLPYNSSNSDEITGLTVSDTGLYVGGYYNLQHVTGVGNTTQSNFLAKVVDTGTSASYVWKQEGNWEIKALASNGSTVYLTGDYFDSATFGATTLTALKSGPPALSNNESFVAKLLDTGSSSSFVWAVRSMSSIGGTSFPRKLVVDNADLYIAGDFRPAKFTLGTTLLTNNNDPHYPNQSLFVAKLHDEGSQAAFVWAQQAIGVARATGIAISSGAVYVTGYQDHSAFSSFLLNSTNCYFSRLASQALPTRSPALQATLSVYPNPAHGAATVHVPAGAGSATLTLFDTLGQMVRTASAPAGADYLLGLTGVAPGLYTLRVQVGEALATQQLAVE